MPIANQVYAKYYNSHKETITEKLRTKYEGGGNEIKKNYYLQHKDEIKAKVIERYKIKKGIQNEQRLKDILTKNIPDETRQAIQNLLDSEMYKTASKKLIDLLETNIIN